MKINKQKVLPLTIAIALNSSYLLANEINIHLPNVPKPVKANARVISAPKVITHNSTSPNIEYEEEPKQGILFDKRTPPNYGKKKTIEKSHKKELVKDNATNSIGIVVNNKLPVYLQTTYSPTYDVMSKLEDANFDVLATYSLDANNDYISIVFTNKDIIKAASKDNRGFAATLRLLINKKDKTININNPLYVMKAFMQEEYDQNLAEDTLEKIKDIFDNLQNSKEYMKFSSLDRYQFMVGLPEYADMLEIASKNNETLLTNARKSNQVIYEQKLNNGSTTIGVKLSTKTNRFLKEIGYKNGELLPYPVLIENNKAKILAPKYYIALMYPTLSMSQFMSISSTPGEIEKDCDKAFR